MYEKCLISTEIISEIFGGNFYLSLKQSRRCGRFSMNLNKRQYYFWIHLRSAISAGYYL